MLFYLFEKDCDDDSDCSLGLICFQRDQGTTDVPGCLGNADQVGDGFDDFCIKPQTDDTLVIAGDEGFPTSAFPLQRCQGDCDTDADWYVDNALDSLIADWIFGLHCIFFHC